MATARATANFMVNVCRGQRQRIHVSGGFEGGRNSFCPLKTGTRQASIELWATICLMPPRIGRFTAFLDVGSGQHGFGCTRRGALSIASGGPLREHIALDLTLEL